MFDSSNRTPRRGGYRQDENPRQRNGVEMSADGASYRPRFNPNFTPQEGGRKRQRFTRTTGATRVEKVEARPSRRPSAPGEFGSERSFRPTVKRNPEVYSQRKRQEYHKNYEDPTKPMRLNKYLANAGICSRREADDFIQAGVITVNGEVVDNLGAKVLPTDKVMFHDQPVRRERKVYILLNKPKNTVTTTDDPQERHTVLDIVRNACAERIYPVGRLDRNTTGVLLLTNDGELASKLTHPRFLKKKVYHVYLDKNVTAHDMRQIAEGIELEDGTIRADAIEYASPTDKKQVGIEIHSGKNRIVRRIFESLGYKVTKLDRVQFAGLTKKSLRRGDWRFLTEKEVDMLRMGAFE